MKGLVMYKHNLKIFFLVLFLISILIPSTVFSEDLSYLRQYRDWSSYSSNQSHNKSITIQTENKEGIFFLISIFNNHISLVIIPKINKNSNINLSLDIKCTYSVDGGNIYTSPCIANLTNNTAFIYITNFDFSQLIPQMGRGNAITFRIYVNDDDFDPYICTFSLMGFTNAWNYAWNELYPRIFGK